MVDSHAASWVGSSVLRRFLLLEPWSTFCSNGAAYAERGAKAPPCKSPPVTKRASSLARKAITAAMSSAREDTGVVDHHVECAEGAHGGLDRGLDLAIFRDVGHAHHAPSFLHEIRIDSIRTSLFTR
jgi:hypothetical protein